MQFYLKLWTCNMSGTWHLEESTNNVGERDVGHEDEQEKMHCPST